MKKALQLYIFKCKNNLIICCIEQTGVVSTLGKKIGKMITQTFSSHRIYCLYISLMRPIIGTHAD